MAKPLSPVGFGFLAAIESIHGVVGGFLVLNAAGRPLEFHCTSPVKATRPQEILYGPTLKEYLYGEQIAQALVSKAKHEPRLVFVDQVETLTMRAVTPCPVLIVRQSQDEIEPLSGLTWMEWSATTLGLVPRGDDEALVRDRLTEAASLDLLEPFSRIREALAETQKSAA